MAGSLQPKLLIVCTAEPNDWTHAESFKQDFSLEGLETVCVSLKPFSPDEINLYLRYLSPNRQETPPASFVQKLMDHTEGNPMLVAVTLKALATQGLLFDELGALAH